LRVVGVDFKVSNTIHFFVLFVLPGIQFSS
jgi:hypothetical protein